MHRLGGGITSAPGVLALVRVGRFRPAPPSGIKTMATNQKRITRLLWKTTSNLSINRILFRQFCYGGRKNASKRSLASD